MQPCLLAVLLAVSASVASDPLDGNATSPGPLASASLSDIAEEPDAAAGNTSEPSQEPHVNATDAGAVAGRNCQDAICQLQCRKGKHNSGSCENGACRCKNETSRALQDGKGIKARNVENHINYNVNQNVNFNSVAQFPIMGPMNGGYFPPFPGGPGGAGLPGGHPGGQPGGQSGGQPGRPPAGPPAGPPGGQAGTHPPGHSTSTPGGQTTAHTTGKTRPTTTGGHAHSALSVSVVGLQGQKKLTP